MDATIEKLNKEYDLDLERVIDLIDKEKAKFVLLQFPDGLKPYALAIVDYLEERVSDDTEFLIWVDTSFGACDTPNLGKELEDKIDLLIHFGHNDKMPCY